MSRLSLWKVQRELRRVGGQISRLVGRTIVEPPRQWLYDRSVDQLETLSQGRHALTGRVAVLVLFQPRGLAGSIRLTLDHLATEGWSVLAVSNVPLSATDREMVLGRVSMLLERPNAGYDFGAYRAGLRRLDRLGNRLDQLILMNDSTWFPVREGDDCLRRMEALCADMAGQIYRSEGGPGRDHVESHLLMFSGTACAHPAFIRFWRGFVMSNDRVTTILEGEKGISQQMMAAGLRVDALIDHDRLASALNALSDGDLRRVMNDLVHHRRDAQAECAALAQQANPRQGFADWVSTALENSRQHLVATTFIAPAMQLCGMGFVKKTRDRRFHLARMKVLELEAAGKIAPLHPAVRAEIEAAVSRWTPTAEELRQAQS